MSKLINDEVRSEYTFPHLYSQAYVEEKNKEIDRLNNIIEELEKWLNEDEYFNGRKLRKDYITVLVTDVLDKIKALKENK